MSTENWKLEKDLCRCCHAEGSFYNLGEPRFDLGQEEVYSDMLRHSFNIDLSPVSGILCAMTYTICEKCILRLRDASNFKRQVLLCEERFKDMYRNIMKALSPDFAVNTTPSIEVKQESPTTFDTEIKEELAPMSEDDEDVFDSRFDNDEDDEKTVLEMKLEDTKKNKGKSKPKPKAKTKKTKKVGRPSKVNELEGNEEPQDLEKNEEAEEDKKKELLKPEKEEPKSIRCEICNTLSNNENMHKKHKKWYHEEVKCGVCNKSFEGTKVASYHVRKTHGVQKTSHDKRDNTKIMCNTCNREFPCEVTLQNHNIYKHILYKCSDCGEMFTNSVLFRHRYRVHLLNMPSCGVCEYKNPSKSQVIAHQRKVHLKEKNISCQLCDCKFFDRSSLKRHMVRHKAEKKYECSFCHKLFPRNATMKMHEKIHLGEKNKVCGICGEKFVQKASLNYHMGKYHPEAC